MWRIAIGDVVFGDVADHFAAAVEGRQRGESRSLAVEHADAGRPVHLVAGEHVVVAVDVANVRREMDRALAAVDEHRHAALMGDAANFLHRNDRAEHVRHVRDGDELRAGVESRLEGLDVERAVLAHLHPLQHRALALAQEVPGHHVGMMLHDGEDDLVAFPDPLKADAVRHEIDRFGRRTSEDDLVLARGVQEDTDAFASVLKAFRRGVRKIVQPAMDVRIFGLVCLAHPVQHLDRLLGRGAVVEINKRFAVYRQRQGRKVGAQTLDVIGRGGRDGFGE